MDVTETPERTEGLIDLSAIPVSQLWSLDQDTVLARSLLRVTRAADEQPNQSISAFSSAL